MPTDATPSPARSLRVRGLGKQFGAQAVLRDIELDIAPGEFLILVGPSGCGKSTLLHCIAGLEQPSQGEIWLGQRRVDTLPPKDRDIAMVFQSYALYPNMDVRGNIAFGLQMRGIPRAEQERRVAEVAAMLQIEPLLGRKPGQLSGGQRQRVAMGRALARNPALFLFDEPLSNLDAQLRVEMRAEIKLLHQRTRTTSVYVTHDQIEAMTLGDRIAVMKDGVIQQLGTPDTIYRQPANRFVAGFMGSPAMNFLPVRVAQGAQGLEAVSGGVDGVAAARIALASGTDAALAGRALTLGVRPEAIRLTADGALRAGVSLLEPTGADTLVTLDLAGSRCVARCVPAEAPRLGDAVRVAIDPAAIVLFDADSGVRVG